MSEPVDPPGAPSTSDDLDALGALSDPTRRAVYELVVRAGEPVGRDRIAEESGLARQTAAYHLDKLAEHGLVEVEFARLTGRTGPGAGRPAKMYRRSEIEYEVSLPPRRYVIPARILLKAMATGSVSGDEMRRAARQVGTDIAGSDGDGALDGILVATGYEPCIEDGEVRFCNCPFDALVEEDRNATCALNLALVEGMVEATGDERVPRLEPEDGYCCVRLGVGASGRSRRN